MFDNDLEFAATFVKANPTSQQDLLSVGRLQACAAVGVGKHGAAHLGFGVFEGEIPVTRAGSSKAREFTAYPDLVKALLNGHARLSVQVSDGQHPSLIGSYARGCGAGI